MHMNEYSCKWIFICMNMHANIWMNIRVVTDTCRRCSSLCWDVTVVSRRTRTDCRWTMKNFSGDSAKVSSLIPQTSVLAPPLLLRSPCVTWRHRVTWHACLARTTVGRTVVDAGRHQGLRPLRHLSPRCLTRGRREDRQLSETNADVKHMQMSETWHSRKYYLFLQLLRKSFDLCTFLHLQQ